MYNIKNATPTKNTVRAVVEIRQDDLLQSNANTVIKSSMLHHHNKLATVQQSATMKTSGFLNITNLV